MAMAFAYGGLARSSCPMRSLISQRKKWVFNPLACSLKSSSYSPNLKHRLILYSKPGCCLCETLQDKLETALCHKALVSFTEFELEVRDITTNPEWERAYTYEVPVLTVIRADGTEFPVGIRIGHRHSLYIFHRERLPRLSPRMDGQRIRMKVEEAVGI